VEILAKNFYLSIRKAAITSVVEYEISNV